MRSTHRSVGAAVSSRTIRVTFPLSPGRSEAQTDNRLPNRLRRKTKKPTPFDSQTWLHAVLRPYSNHQTTQPLRMSRLALEKTQFSSEGTSLLRNGGGNGGGNLNEPFMQTYNDRTTNPPGGTAGAATGPQRPPTTAELQDLENARREAVAAQVEVPDEPSEHLTGKRVLLTCLVSVFAYLCLGVIAYTSLAGMDFVDALYFCVGELSVCAAVHTVCGCTCVRL